MRVPLKGRLAEQMPARPARSFADAGSSIGPTFLSLSSGHGTSDLATEFDVEERSGRVLVTCEPNIAERLHSGSFPIIELHGTDLPAGSISAKVRGTITGRSVYVDSWESEPYSTSPWAEPRVEGTDTKAADAIADTVPENWPLISTGMSTTTAGRSAVMLEVDHLTPEMITWFDSQPPGSVQLDAFVHLTTGPAQAKQ